MQPVVRTDEEWRARLTAQEYAVLRQADTDRPHKGEYTTFQPKAGHFVCKGCDAPLYSAASKFPCSCGWPAFNKAYQGFVATKTDSSGGMVRVEILCAACQSHLGHVFNGEGLTPTNQRHCVNSTSVKYTEAEPQAPLPEATV
eukprot:TRINITY_DN21714_c0_g1_i1.p1 TRINITY_DN21714_c0_g1~~TRINITY_DN21714_c0_g1_i1.p1  ORF type:complete len:143 (+),score=36.29 TRINITY_DN21714_c0_g1_i1:51-479(+)